MSSFWAALEWELLDRRLATLKGDPRKEAYLFTDYLHSIKS